MSFDRKTYFDSVRGSLFAGTMTQQQVNGQEYILDAWETYVPGHDMRWLANFLAQAAHETGFTMWPIAEYHGAEQPYGQPDPETKQRYYGRGLIQITHRENYAKTDKELHLSGDESCEWHADNMLLPDVSAMAGYQGMREGWFRSDSKGKQAFSRYFNDLTNDPYGAREIVNGDKTVVPSWSSGVSIGNLIKGYHEKFLTALKSSFRGEPLPPPEPASPVVVTITVGAPPEVRVEVRVVQPDA